MVQLSGPALRQARAESWRSRARRASGGLDAQFIFSWIAFNALYGQARYRESDDRPRSEMGDIVNFLKLMLDLDARSGSAVLRDQTLKPDFDCLLGDKF